MLAVHLGGLRKIIGPLNPVLVPLGRRIRGDAIKTNRIERGVRAACGFGGSGSTRASREQRKIDLLLTTKLALRAQVVRGNADNLSSQRGQLGMTIAETPGLDRADRRERLGIEVQNDRLATQLREAQAAAIR